MVIQRSIDNLRERPHHERRAVAFFIALGVVIILFLGWAYTFFSDIRASAEADTQAQKAAQQQ